MVADAYALASERDRHAYTYIQLLACMRAFIIRLCVFVCMFENYNLCVELYFKRAIDIVHATNIPFGDYNICVYVIEWVIHTNIQSKTN